MPVRLSLSLSTLNVGLAALGLASASAQAQSQDATSRAIVQPLPTPEVQSLNRALQRLARKPRDLDALIDAGNAALKVDDLDAAMGFFGRAEDLSTENPRVKAGIATVFLRSGRPVEALEQYDAAERAGASMPELVLDRGLAYDLVGDSARAQASYRLALRANSENAEAIRRLALSQAISGERNAFESTLRPLIDRRDFAAFRTRAFGLAILGDQDRAAAITDAVMPRDLASRITPYLAFMPRLTKAQQAAAANLGIFPRAADIGRDDPQIANYAAQTVASTPALAAVAGADNRLEPAGEPLGAGPVEAETIAAVDAPAEASQPPTVQVAAEPVVQTVRAEEDQAVPVEPVRVAVNTPESSTTPRPGFDLARVSTVNNARTSDAVSAVRGGEGAPTPSPQTQSQAEPNFTDAFADLDGPDAPATPSSANAVNIAAIEIPREVAPEPAKPTKPKHPSRIWVQVATGRDISALRFDWRRLSRKAPDLLRGFDPHIVSWGQSNRLLAGPVESQGEARRLVNALKREGIDTFSYTSPEGTEIKEIK